jgi:alpha-beta hydrolase superfamily lysophospholipase
VPAELVELPRKVQGAGGTATLACTLLVPRTHAEMKRGRKPVAPAAVAPAAPGGLTITPEAPRPLPGVVLLSGFGAQDRDGNSVGPGDFHLYFAAALARKLGEAGVASLRCDDRGAGQSTGDFKRATFDTLAGDARAELQALRAEPAVDPARTALVGHSEGALEAMSVGARDGKLRALALLAPPGRPLDALILEQEQASMRRFGLAENEVTASLAELRATYDAVRAGKPLPGSLSRAERRAVQESSPWLRSHFRRAPLGDAPKLAGLPVLVAAGAKDVQISVKDAELARDALVAGGNRTVTYKVYPELNHLFAVSKNASVADYYDPMAEVDGVFLNDVSAFLSASLSTARVAAR